MSENVVIPPAEASVQTKKRKGDSHRVKKSVLQGKVTKSKHTEKVGRNSAIASSKPDKPKKAASSGDGGRKKPKWKAATVASREIKLYQRGKKATDFLLTKSCIEDLAREAMAKFGAYHLQACAITALREAVEMEGVKIMATAAKMAAHAGRITIMPEDMRIVNEVKEMYPEPPSCNRLDNTQFSAFDYPEPKKIKDKRSLESIADDAEESSRVTELKPGEELSVSVDDLVS